MQRLKKENNALSMNNYKKVWGSWETMRKCAKSQENMRVCLKLWNYEKVCKKLRKCAKWWKSMRKCAKSWESMPKAQLLIAFLQYQYFSAHAENIFWCILQIFYKKSLGCSTNWYFRFSVCVCVKASSKTPCCCQKGICKCVEKHSIVINCFKRTFFCVCKKWWKE